LRTKAFLFTSYDLAQQDAPIKNYEYALDFALRSPLGGLLFCLRVTIVIPALVTSDIPGQEGCTVAVPLSDPSRNRVRPDARLQIKGRKNAHIHTAARKFVH
jgi:hypothetical protein